MRRVVRAASPELMWSSDGSPISTESSYRELEDVYLQTQTKIWLGEVLHIRFDEDSAVANLLADGELLFQVSKVIWKMLLKKDAELKHSKIHIYEKTSSGKSDGRYMPYPKVDSFLKICKIMGLTGIDLFSPSDVVEKRDVRRVCMCIRTLSKKSRLKNLDVPDFDLVTYTIAMPTDLVGGIRKTLEQSQCSSSSSNSYTPCMDSRELYKQRSIRGDYARYYDSFSESDEAESTFVEPEYENLLSEYDPNLSHTVIERSSDENLVFDEHSSIFEEFMKAFLVPPSSSHEANIHTGDNRSVTSECSVTIEDITNKGCAYTTEVPTANCDSSNMRASNTAPDNEPSEAYTVNTEGGETNLNSSIFKVESSASELVASNAEEATNTNLYYDKIEEDIALPISEKNGSSADTDATDWSSASETESNFLYELSLLQSMFDPQEMHSCGETDVFESLGSSSSTTSEKQIIPEVLDDLQIYGDDSCVPEVDLDIIDSPFDTETPHNKSECPMRDAPMTALEVAANELPNESIMVAEDGDVRDVPTSALEMDVNELPNESIMVTEDGDVRDVPTTALEVDTNELLNESIMVAEESSMVVEDGDVRDVSTALEVDTNELPNESIMVAEESIMVDVRDVSTITLEVDMNELPNESIMVAEDGDVSPPDLASNCMVDTNEVDTNESSMVVEDGDVSPLDLASNCLPVRESNTYSYSRGSTQSDASTHLDADVVESQLASGDTCHLRCDTNENSRAEVKEELCEEQSAEISLEENTTTNILQFDKCCFSGSTEKDGENDGCLISSGAEQLHVSPTEPCTAGGETSTAKLSDNVTVPNLQENVSGDMFSDVFVSASDDTEMQIGNDGVEREASIDNLNETHQSETGAMNIAIDQNAERGLVLDGTRSMVTHNDLDAPNDGHSDNPITINDPVDPVHSSGATYFEDILGRETIIEVKNLVQPKVDDNSLASMKFKEGDDTIQVEKGTKGEEFEKGEASEQRKPGKKVLKSIAGGVTLLGALFFVLHHLKGKRDKERTNRAVVPPQVRNVRREPVETGKSDKIYPADRLKF